MTMRAATGFYSDYCDMRLISRATAPFAGRFDIVLDLVDWRREVHEHAKPQWALC